MASWPPLSQNILLPTNEVIYSLVRSYTSAKLSTLRIITSIGTDAQ